MTTALWVWGIFAPSFTFIAGCLLVTRVKEAALRKAWKRAAQAECQRDEALRQVKDLAFQLAVAVGHPSVRVPDYLPADWAE